MNPWFIFTRRAKLLSFMYCKKVMFSFRTKIPILKNRAFYNVAGFFDKADNYKNVDTHN